MKNKNQQNLLAKGKTLEKVERSKYFVTIKTDRERNMGEDRLRKTKFQRRL